MEMRPSSLCFTYLYWLCPVHASSTPLPRHVHLVQQSRWPWRPATCDSYGWNPIYNPAERNTMRNRYSTASSSKIMIWFVCVCARARPCSICRWWWRYIQPLQIQWSFWVWAQPMRRRYNVTLVSHLLSPCPDWPLKCRTEYNIALLWLAVL